MNASYARSLHTKLFVPGNSAHVFPFLAPAAALRGKVETKEAECAWPGSPGVPPDPSLELSQPGEVALFVVYVVEKPTDLCYNICCYLCGSKESL